MPPCGQAERRVDGTAARMLTVSLADVWLRPGEDRRKTPVFPHMEQ